MIRKHVTQRAITVVRLIASTTLILTCTLADISRADDPVSTFDRIKDQIGVDIKAQPLRTAVTELLDKRDIPWTVDADVMQTFDNAIAGEMQLSNAVSVRSVLLLLLEPHGLAIRKHDNLMMIQSGEKARQVMTEKLYHLEEIVSPEFPVETMVREMRKCCSWPAGSQILILSSTAVLVRNQIGHQESIADKIMNVRNQNDTEEPPRTCVPNALAVPEE